MHAKFKGYLITGYLKREERFLLWKEQFKVYCKIDEVIDGTTGGHFDFLEKEGLIKIGEYAVLRAMFEHVDATAVEDIDKKSAEIKKALQNNNNKS